MSLVFRSSIPEQFEIRSVDSNGRQRSAVATRKSGDFNWEMRLTHPSGRNWQATYHGDHIIDALGELLVSKNSEYLQERGRGYRPEPAQRDHSRQVPETGEFSPITPITRR